MAKFYNLGCKTPPVLLDRCVRLDAFQMQQVFRQAAAATNKHSSYLLTWGKNKMRAVCDMEAETLRLEYTCNGEAQQYTYRLARVYSNMIPNTYHWLFICPDTHRSCRLLYLHGGVFRSRYAIPHAMYQQQTESRKQRTSFIYCYLLGAEAMEAEYKKRGRVTYNGKETRPHARWEKKQCKKLDKAISSAEKKLHRKFQ